MKVMDMISIEIGANEQVDHLRVNTPAAHKHPLHYWSIKKLLGLCQLLRKERTVTLASGK